MSNSPTKKNKLIDVEVSTVGLVTTGANRETFFLTKSADGEEQNHLEEVDMSDVQKDENTEVVEPEILEITTPVVESLKPEEANFIRKLAKAFGFVNDPDETPEKEPEIEKKDESVLDAKIQELEKAQDELKTELEKARNEAATEREEREKRDYLAKAETYAALPIKKDEFGTRLFELHKANPDLAEYFEGVFTAVANQLKEAGLYDEFGTSTSPDASAATDAVAKAEELVKAGKFENFRDAFMSLGEDDAYNVINKRRESLRKSTR